MAYNTPGEVLTDIANSIRTLYGSTSSIPFVDMPELIKDAIGEPIDISDYNGTSWILPFMEHIDFTGIRSIDGMFSYIDSVLVAPTRSLDLRKLSVTGLTSLNNVFEFSKLTEILGIEDWDTSSMTEMEETFNVAYINTLDLSNWDTSEVTTMNNMFDGATVTKMWVPSTFVATAVTNSYHKPFRSGNLVIYTDATDAATQGWGTIGPNVVIHYNSTYQDFINA